MNLSLAILAGFFSSLGSVCSKMPSILHIRSETYSYLPLCINVLFMGLMVLCNVSGLFWYTKSLRQTDSTVVSTITSTASNYIVSGFFGVLLYGETLTLLWLCGTTFVLVGLILISSDDSSSSLSSSIVPKVD